MKSDQLEKNEHTTIKDIETKKCHNSPGNNKSPQDIGYLIISRMM